MSHRTIRDVSLRGLHGRGYRQDIGAIQATFARAPAARGRRMHSESDGRGGERAPLWQL